MDDIRWKQRFDNFQRALVLLREVRERGVANLSEMEKEGAAQRFEFTFELAWKTMKDFMEAQGESSDLGFPRRVIKMAIARGIIKEPYFYIWMEMLDQRNQLSHRYDRQMLNAALEQVVNRFQDAFEQLHTFFLENLVEA
ncbi:MAG: nucleotidyltransferase substrate binding protein [Magnetococcus sp. YQC-9]